MQNLGATVDYIFEEMNSSSNKEKTSEAKETDITENKETIENSEINQQTHENTETITENNNEKLEIEEQTQVENTENIETINTDSVDTSSENGKIVPIVADGGTDPELLDKFKQEFKAVLSDNKEIIDELANEAEKEIDSLEDKLDEKTKNDILNTIQDNYKDDKKVNDYINSFSDGSVERQYAEAVAKLRTYLDLDEESNLSKEEKLDMLISKYNSKGLNIPQELSKVKDEEYIDRLTIANKEENKGQDIISSNTQQKDELFVEEIRLPDEVVEPVSKVDVRPDEKINKIKDVNLRELMKDLANINPVKYRIKGELDGNIENKLQSEIETDFEANIKSLTEKVGKEPKNLQEIYESMNRKAQQQFIDYKKGKIPPEELEGSAKDLAIIERQAKYLKFKMQVGSNNFQVGFDDGSNYVAQ